MSRQASFASISRQGSFANLSRQGSFANLSRMASLGSAPATPRSLQHVGSFRSAQPARSWSLVRAALVLVALLGFCSLGWWLMLAREGSLDGWLMLDGSERAQGTSSSQFGGGQPRGGPLRRRRKKRVPRVCIVFDAERAEAGLAVAVADLLRLLATSSHFEVTALRLDDPRGLPLPAALAAVDHSLVQWVALPPTQHTYDGSAAAVASFRALEWLRDVRPPFKHVVFHAAGGAAHYPLLAREEGLALVRSRVSVIMAAPRQLLWRRRPGAGASVEELEEDHMQRGVAARSDALVASADALRFMRANGWQLPRHSAAWTRRAARVSAAARDGHATAAAAAEEEDGGVDVLEAHLESMVEE